MMNTDMKAIDEDSFHILEPRYLLVPHYHHGIAYVAAALKKAGHRVELLAYDNPVERERLIEDVKRFQPNLVGFSVATNQYKYARPAGRTKIRRQSRSWRDRPPVA